MNESIIQKWFSDNSLLAYLRENFNLSDDFELSEGVSRVLDQDNISPDDIYEKIFEAEEGSSNKEDIELTSIEEDSGLIILNFLDKTDDQKKWRIGVLPRSGRVMRLYSENNKDVNMSPELAATGLGFGALVGGLAGNLRGSKKAKDLYKEHAKANSEAINKELLNISKKVEGGGMSFKEGLSRVKELNNTSKKIAKGSKKALRKGIKRSTMKGALIGAGIAGALAGGQALYENMS